MHKRTERKEEVQRTLAPTTVLMLLTNTYDPDPRVRQEALTLIATGCRVRLLAWDRDCKSPSAECMEGVEVERVFLRSRHGRGTTQIFFYLWLYLRMLRRGWRISFDVVHCHDLDTLPVGFLLGKLKGKPIVYDSHEIFVDMLEGSIHPLVRRGLRWLEELLIRRIDLLITVGGAFKRYFDQRGARRVVVVGNWKRREHFSRSEEQNHDLRRRLSIPAEAMVVTCITHLSKDRKIEELLQAADQCPNVYVILGGDGELQPIVQEWAAKHPRVIYLGFVPAAEIPAYTCVADIIYSGYDPAHPYARFRAPHKLYEALAAGKPIIASDSGESGDVVRGASCGIVLPSAYGVSAVRDALEAMQSTALRNAYARNARYLGRTEMNWEKGEKILYREYSRLRPARMTPGVQPTPDADRETVPVSGRGE